MGSNPSQDVVQKPESPPVTLLPALQRQKLSKALRRKRPGSGNKDRLSTGNKESSRPGSASWSPFKTNWRPGSGNKDVAKKAEVSFPQAYFKQTPSGSIERPLPGSSWQPLSPDQSELRRAGSGNKEQLDISISDRPSSSSRNTGEGAGNSNSDRPSSGTSWRPYSTSRNTGEERHDTGKSERPASSSSWRPFSPNWRAGRGKKERPNSASSEVSGNANWKNWALRPATPLLSAAAEALRPATPSSWRPTTPQWIRTLSRGNKSAEVTTIHVRPPTPPPPSAEPTSSDIVRFGNRGRPLLQAQEKDDVFAVDLTSTEGIDDQWTMRPASNSDQRSRPVTPKVSYPLLDATSLGDIDQMRHYLRCGADPNSCHDNGVTALHIAAGLGNVEAVKELLGSGAWPSCRMEAVRKLESPGGETPGHIAVRRGHLSSLLPLLKARAEVDAIDIHGRTMLHHSAEMGNSQAVRALLISRADCNVRNSVKRTPLHDATERGNVSVVRMMVQHGANPHLRDKLGHSPLNIALKCRKEKVAIAVINACGTVGIRDDESLQESLGDAREWICDDGLF